MAELRPIAEDICLELRIDDAAPAIAAAVGKGVTLELRIRQPTPEFAAQVLQGVGAALSDLRRRKGG